MIKWITTLVIYFGLFNASFAMSADVSGKLIETFDSGGYTYLKIKTAAGLEWAAVAQAKLKLGDQVVLKNPMEMKNFESKTLKRKFEKIYFAELGGNAKAGAEISNSANPHAGVDMSAYSQAAPKIDISQYKITKASGVDGKNISEIFGQAASLNQKTVSVQGVVVKYLPGIMKKNWVHLQDQTGSEAKKDNDLVLTTMGEAKPGTYVKVSGVVKTNQDFGHGYKYPVMIEDAKIEIIK